MNKADLSYPSFGDFYNQGGFSPSIYAGSGLSTTVKRGYAAVKSTFTRTSNLSEYNDQTQTTLMNANKYANRILTQSSTNHLSSFLSALAHGARALPSVNYTPTIFEFNFDGATNKKEEKKESDNLYVRIAVCVLGTALLGTCAYVAASVDREIQKSKSLAKEILNSRDFYQLNFEDPTIAGVRFVTVLHSRMLNRETEDYQLMLKKAMVGAAIGAAMASGAVFGSVIIMQTSVVGAIFFAGYAIYDHTRGTENSKNNRIDAHIMLNVLQELTKSTGERQDSSLLRNLNGQPSLQCSGCNECVAQPGRQSPPHMDARNWQTFLPPAYEEAIQAGQYPDPSAPDLPPPAYTECHNQ